MAFYFSEKVMLFHNFCKSLTHLSAIPTQLFNPACHCFEYHLSLQENKAIQIKNAN